MSHKLKILSGSANLALAQEVAEHLGIPLTPIDIRKFRDGEVWCRIGESVRGQTVFVIQPTCPPVNDNLMELLVIVDALKRASAQEINVVIPYFGYARQDRKSRPREPISAKLVANMIQAAGVDRVIAFDLHMGQVQGFFDIPTDNIEAMPLLAKHFLDKQLNDVIVISPDIGGTIRARKMAQALNTQLAIIDKRRPRPGEAEVVNVIGDVEGKRAIIMDDIIDSGGTIVHAAARILELGAIEVYAAATHAVFSDGAIDKLVHSPLKEIVVTNTIPIKKRHEKLSVLSIANVLAHSIHSIHEAESMGKVFEEFYGNLRKTPDAGKSE
jgi:ribose-phosphate pyrophosphokinase